MLRFRARLTWSRSTSTRRVSNGTHQIQVVLFDAAGNRTLSDAGVVEFATAARPTERTRVVSRVWTPGSRRGRRDIGPRRRSRYGRTRAIVGTLVDEAGAPISDAVSTSRRRRRGPEHRRASLGQVATDAAGRFRYLPRSGSSRKLTVSYRAFHLDYGAVGYRHADAECASGGHAECPSSARDCAREHPVQRQVARRTGRAGTQVVIYALGGARCRIPVATVRANAKGRFHYRYRFQNARRE